MHSTHPTNRNLQVGLVGMLYSESEAMSATAAAAIKVMLTPSPPASAAAAGPPALGPEPSLGGTLGTGGAPAAAGTSFLRPSTSRGRATLPPAAAAPQPVVPQKTEAEIMVRCSPMHAWALLRT